MQEVYRLKGINISFSMEWSRTIAIHGFLLIWAAIFSWHRLSSKWNPATQAEQKRGTPTVDARILWELEKESLTKISTTEDNCSANFEQLASSPLNSERFSRRRMSAFSSSSILDRLQLEMHLDGATLSWSTDDRKSET